MFPAWAAGRGGRGGDFPVVGVRLPVEAVVAARLPRRGVLLPRLPAAASSLVGCRCLVVEVGRRKVVNGCLPPSHVKDGSAGGVCMSVQEAVLPPQGSVVVVHLRQLGLLSPALCCVTCEAVGGDV